VENQSENGMTSLERVQCVLNGEVPDRVPISILSFQNAARFAGQSVGAYCRSGEGMAEAQTAYWEEFRHDVIDIENGIAAMAEAVGCRVEYPENEPPWVVQPALRSLEQVDRLPEIDPSSSPSLAELIKATGILADRLGKEVCIRGESDQGPFSLAAEILGPEAFLTALLDPHSQERVKRLLSYAEEQIFKLACAQAAAGSHITLIGDSIAGPDVCSPDLYRRFALPYERKLARRLKKKKIGLGIHICGNATAIVADMIRSGALYLELDHKIQAGKVRELTAGRITLFGTLDPVELLCRGTEEEIREQVRREIELFAPGGGYVLSPGCTLAYETPFENVRALVDAGRQFGVYAGRELLNRLGG
jgi:uroporphyrinogen decarboxylase